MYLPTLIFLASIDHIRIQLSHLVKQFPDHPSYNIISIKGEDLFHPVGEFPMIGGILQLVRQ